MAFEKGRVDVGWCVVESRKKSDKLRVKVRLGPSSPKPMTGYGGWTLRARPKERALTTWEGTEPLRVQIDLMFDEFISRDAGDLETDIKALERMAGLTRDGESPPPLLRWEANAPHDWRERPNYDWVIENLEFGEGLYNDWGDRLRQQVTVTFLEHVDEDYTTLTPSQRHRAEQKRNRNNRSSKTNNHRRGGGSSKTYTVVAGDTLSEIASRKLGNANRWKEIAKINNIRDPRNIRVGQRLRLP